MKNLFKIIILLFPVLAISAPIQEPEAGKAVVYVCRDSTFGMFVPHTIKIDDESFSTFGYKQLKASLEVGKHTITSESALATNSIEIDVKEGDIVLMQQDVEISLFLTKSKLVLLSGEEGKKIVESCYE